MLEQKAVEIIDKLAIKIGIASNKIWEWALLQVKVDLVISLVLGFIALIGTILFLIMLYKNFNKLVEKDSRFIHSEYKKLTIKGWIFIISGSILFIYNIFILPVVYYIPQYIINPEYTAFKDIINQLSQLE